MPPRGFSSAAGRSARSPARSLAICSSTATRSGEPGVAFTIAIIALGAKMAKADGVVTDEEIEAFERIFRVPPAEAANVRRIFNLARQDTAGYEVYAAQIARAFRDNPAMLEDILDGLFEIAKADGVLHPGEQALPGARRRDFRLRARRVPPHPRHAFRTRCGRSLCRPRRRLQRERRRVKHTYRMLVRENHPDSLIGRGVPEEFVRLATDKLAAINAAYEKILEERGIGV